MPRESRELFAPSPKLPPSPSPPRPLTRKDSSWEPMLLVVAVGVRFGAVPETLSCPNSLNLDTPALRPAGKLADDGTGDGV